MTPLELAVLLHYHVSPADWRDEIWAAPLNGETFKKFVEDGLLTENPAWHPVANAPARYHATVKLHAFCKLLCATPLPIQVWVHPDKFKQ